MCDYVWGEESILLVRDRGPGWYRSHQDLTASRTRYYSPSVSVVGPYGGGNVFERRAACIAEQLQNGGGGSCIIQTTCDWSTPYD